MNTVYFNYSIDCELPVNTPYTQGRELEPYFRGPADWQLAEASVRGFVAQMDALGVLEGCSLFVYPDVAREQASLYREMAAAGIEVALHLNGCRYSRLQNGAAKWLGAMNYEEQHRALELAKHDLEDVIGRPCLGYRACYGSANDDTFPILESLGFEWASNSSNRYRPEFHANWSGSWRYAHHASRQSKLVPGDLALFEIPVTVGIHSYYDPAIRQPLDLRVETPPEILGSQRGRLRDVIAENVEEMQRRQVPVPAIIGASHNVVRYNDPSNHYTENLTWTVRHSQDVCAAASLSMTPASFASMRGQGIALGSY